MVDIARQVTHWHDGALEDWQVAADLIEKRRARHALFFMHLAVEKALKAQVCRHTGDLAPRTHNLVRLVEVAGLALSSEHFDLLAETNEFALSGRYPDTTLPMPSLDDAAAHRGKLEEVFQWLIRLS
jgi:HEPN domain-containing protein